MSAARTAVSLDPALRAAVIAWRDDDPDPETRHELDDLLVRADSDGSAAGELRHRFSGRLEFGTAGLRGELGAGPNCMNRAVVIQTAAGLASYLLDAVGSGRVAVGYDARHKSDVFAFDTAAVLQAAGLHPVVLPRPLPTPVLAFAIRELACIAGVMVTASHNPPRDNGYKVYLGDGSQIGTPTDAEISAHIAAAGAVPDIARCDGWSVATDALVERYVRAVVDLVQPGSARDLTMVYTPLHGVGQSLVDRVLASAGFPAPVQVPGQALPDPDFPTLEFPNPEEPGALDLALEQAATTGADLVLANDPDADRCAAAVPVGGSWRLLRGDEVGLLLADVLLRRGVTGVFATTIVSSSMMKLLAEDNGAAYTETLTGFKWLTRVPGLAYAYEEALGYCVAPHLVRDKDGISALLLLAELAADLKSHGRTLLGRLDELARRYGVHVTDQVSVRVSEPAQIRRMMQELRSSPPVELGGRVVERAEDLATGGGELPPTDGLRYSLTGGARVVVRPSGTEPKLKAYLQVVIPVAGDDQPAVASARRRADEELRALRRDVARLLALSE
jgi:phosphomannomutase